MKQKPKFLSFIKQIDMFGQKVELNIKNEDQYTTIFGGFASIAIIVILILVFWSNVISFFAKTSVTILQVGTFDSDPDLLVLNDQNYMIALSIQQQVLPFNTRPYFNITLAQKNWTRYENGTLVKRTTYIELIPCTLDRFQKVFQNTSNFTDQFNSLGLSTWLCPKYNYSMYLTGTYASNSFMYTTIIVNNCTNNSNTLGWNPVCAPVKVATQDYLDNAMFKVQLYMTNNVVNAYNPTEYVQPYLDNSLYFPFIPYQLNRQANIFFRKYDFENDQSLLPYEDIQTEIYNVRLDSDYRDLTLLGFPTDSVFAQFFLRRSNFSATINRNYQKVAGLMSYLGGFLQIMMFFCGLAIAIYNKQSYLIDLSNMLYEFDFSEEQQNKKKDAVNNEIGDLILTPRANTQRKFIQQSEGQSMQMIKVQSEKKSKIFESNNQLGSPQTGFSYPSEDVINKQQEMVNSQEIKNKTQYLQHKVLKIINRAKYIPLSAKYIITKLFCGKIFHSKEYNLLNKALDRIHKELDIEYILQQLHEVQKLKQILLTKPQQILFNFTPKPIISMKNQKVIVTRSMLQTEQISQQTVELDNKSQKLGLKAFSEQNQYPAEIKQNQQQLNYYKKLFKAYETILSSINDNPINTFINQQLLSQIGTEVLEIFQASVSVKYTEEQQQGTVPISKSSKFKKNQVKIYLQTQQQSKSSENCSIGGMDENLGQIEIADIKIIQQQR